jgi:hypothetical protein
MQNGDSMRVCGTYDGSWSRHDEIGNKEIIESQQQRDYEPFSSIF